MSKDENIDRLSEKIRDMLLIELCQNNSSQSSDAISSGDFDQIAQCLTNVLSMFIEGNMKQAFWYHAREFIDRSVRIKLDSIKYSSVSQISGVNEELLGSATDDKAGILSQLRQGAGLTSSILGRNDEKNTE
jgi:hypothetical protein